MTGTGSNWDIRRFAAIDNLFKLFSSPEPQLSQRLTGELIVYTCSGVRRCRCCCLRRRRRRRRRRLPFSKVFSSETA